MTDVCCSVYILFGRIGVILVWPSLLALGGTSLCHRGGYFCSIFIVLFIFFSAILVSVWGGHHCGPLAGHRRVIGAAFFVHHLLLCLCSFRPPWCPFGLAIIAVCGRDVCVPFACSVIYICLWRTMTYFGLSYVS